MSRIDEALRRAGLATYTPAPAEQVSTLELLPSDDGSADGVPVALESLPSELRSADESPVAPEYPTELPAAAGEPAPALAVPGRPKSRALDPKAIFQRFNTALDEKLVVTAGIHPVSMEQYRRLAATLHHAQTDRGIKVVMVASALLGEGKTLTATNLALTLSESYQRRVLLVDADLRRPQMHDVFQVPNVSGLNDGLKAEVEGKLSLIEISPRLSVLLAGRPDPDPMSGLTSNRMRRVIAEAAANFDWVILDTPPVGLLPDANLLAAMVEAVVLVIAAGRTPHASIQKAVAALGRDRILGVVLNKVDERVASPSDYYQTYESNYAGASSAALIEKTK